MRFIASRPSRNTTSDDLWTIEARDHFDIALARIQQSSSGTTSTQARGTWRSMQEPRRGPGRERTSSPSSNSESKAPSESSVCCHPFVLANWMWNLIFASRISVPDHADRRVLQVADEMRAIVKSQGACDLLKGKVSPVSVHTRRVASRCAVSWLRLTWWRRYCLLAFFGSLPGRFRCSCSRMCSSSRRRARAARSRLRCSALAVLSCL